MKWKRRVYVTPKDGECIAIALDDLLDDESGYMRKIVGDIIMHEMTDRQAQIASMYYFGGMNVVEISGLLDVNRSTISRILNAADRRISKNIGQYKAECIHIIDETDTPKVISHISRVYKIRDEPKPNGTYWSYRGMSNQYEETIAFIESRIRQLDKQLKSPSLTYPEKKPLRLRIKMLEQELSELYDTAHKVGQYADK